MGSGASNDKPAEKKPAEKRETPAERVDRQLSQQQQRRQQKQSSPQPSPARSNAQAEEQRRRDLGLDDSDEDTPKGPTPAGNKQQEQQPQQQQARSPPSQPLEPKATPKKKRSTKVAAGALPTSSRSVKLFSGKTVGEWKKGRMLGKGATGKVYESLDTSTEGVFCVKEVEFPEDFADIPAERARYEALRAEIALLSAVEHPNVVRFLGIDKIEFNIYVQMEFVNGGSIQDLIHHFGALSDDITGRYTLQMLEALAYIHKKGIIHRDVKGANVLVDVDGHVKLADFGAAKRCMDTHQVFKTLAGTPYWMAPEVVRQEGHNKAADVWSLGATVLQMVSGLAPYQLLPPVPALFKIGHSNENPIPNDLAVSPLIIDFMQRCLQRSAGGRPTMAQLLEHPWMVAVKAGSKFGPAPQLQSFSTSASFDVPEEGTSHSGGTRSTGNSAGSPVHSNATTTVSSGPPGDDTKGQLSERPPGTTEAAVARRGFLATENAIEFEEEEILDFIRNLTVAREEGTAVEDMPPLHQSFSPGATADLSPEIDIERFDDEHFSSLISQLAIPVDQ